MSNLKYIVVNVCRLYSLGPTLLTEAVTCKYFSFFWYIDVRQTVLRCCSTVYEIFSGGGVGHFRKQGLSNKKNRLIMVSAVIMASKVNPSNDTNICDCFTSSPKD